VKEAMARSKRSIGSFLQSRPVFSSHPTLPIGKGTPHPPSPPLRLPWPHLVCLVWCVCGCAIVRLCGVCGVRCVRCVRCVQSSPARRECGRRATW
jgi:hypothetical protein